MPHQPNSSESAVYYMPLPAALSSARTKWIAEPRLKVITRMEIQYW